MKKHILYSLALVLILLTTTGIKENEDFDTFQAKAYYFSKTKMELGNWGATMSEAQKKDVAARLQNRLEKTYILSFNREESFFYEDEKLDALSGATDSWGKNFSPGKQYKNIKTNSQIQNQEIYGKKFLVKDSLQPIKWAMTSDTKKIGNYTCFKATALIPTNELTWYSFSWSKISNENKKTEEGEAAELEIDMTAVEAWYTLQIPVGHGPLEYWGLPGLILEVSADNTTLLCSKIVINPKEEIIIEAPTKGDVVTKKEYQDIVIKKMKEYRSNRMGRR